MRVHSQKLLQSNGIIFFVVVVIIDFFCGWGVKKAKLQLAEIWHIVHIWRIFCITHTICLVKNVFVLQSFKLRYFISRKVIESFPIYSELISELRDCWKLLTSFFGPTASGIDGGLLFVIYRCGKTIKLLRRYYLFTPELHTCRCTYN